MDRLLSGYSEDASSQRAIRGNKGSKKKKILTIFVYIAFCCIMALFYMELEYDNDVADRAAFAAKMHKAVLEIQKQCPRLCDNEVDEVMFRDFTRQKLDDINDLKNRLGIGDDYRKETWTFLGSFFFVLTTSATIGYGHPAPKTPAGRITTMFLYLFGVPFTFMALMDIVDLFLTFEQFILGKLGEAAMWMIMRLKEVKCCKGKKRGRRTVRCKLFRKKKNAVCPADTGTAGQSGKCEVTHSEAGTQMHHHHVSFVDNTTTNSSDILETSYTSSRQSSNGCSSKQNSKTSREEKLLKQKSDYVNIKGVAPLKTIRANSAGTLYSPVMSDGADNVQEPRRKTEQQEEPTRDSKSSNTETRMEEKGSSSYEDKMQGPSVVSVKIGSNTTVSPKGAKEIHTPKEDGQVQNDTEKKCDLREPSVVSIKIGSHTELIPRTADQQEANEELKVKATDKESSSCNDAEAEISKPSLVSVKIGSQTELIPTEQIKSKHEEHVTGKKGTPSKDSLGEPSAESGSPSKLRTGTTDDLIVQEKKTEQDTEKISSKPAEMSKKSDYVVIQIEDDEDNSKPAEMSKKSDYVVIQIEDDEDNSHAISKKPSCDHKEQSHDVNHKEQSHDMKKPSCDSVVIQIESDDEDMYSSSSENNAKFYISSDESDCDNKNNSAKTVPVPTVRTDSNSGLRKTWHSSMKHAWSRFTVKGGSLLENDKLTKQTQPVTITVMNASNSSLNLKGPSVMNTPSSHPQGHKTGSSQHSTHHGGKGTSRSSAYSNTHISKTSRHSSQKSIPYGSATSSRFNSHHSSRYSSHFGPRWSYLQRSAAAANRRRSYNRQIADENQSLPHITMAFAMVNLIIYICCGAILYVKLEGWTYLNSIYFILTSVSTVGFGDILPKGDLFLLQSSIYILIGLALLAKVIGDIRVSMVKLMAQTVSTIENVGQSAKEKIARGARKMSMLQLNRKSSTVGSHKFGNSGNNTRRSSTVTGASEDQVLTVRDIQQQPHSNQSVFQSKWPDHLPLPGHPSVTIPGSSNNPWSPSSQTRRHTFPINPYNISDIPESED